MVEAVFDFDDETVEEDDTETEFETVFEKDSEIVIDRVFEILLERDNVTVFVKIVFVFVLKKILCPNQAFFGRTPTFNDTHILRLPGEVLSPSIPVPFVRATNAYASVVVE